MVFKRQDNGGKVVAFNHSLMRILHDTPNNIQTSFEFREMMMGHLVLRGNFYALKEMNGAGRVTSLIPLNPDRMKVAKFNGELIYEYTWEDNGQTEVFLQEKIWHVKGLSDDGIIGLTPITIARDAIGLALSTEEYGARFFSNDATPGGILETPGILGEDAAKLLKESWQAAHSGGKNAHNIAVLEQGLSWKAMSVSNEDSQFLETRNFQVEDIARIFRVPAVMIDHPTKTMTFASAEQFFLSFAVHTIRPWLVRIEQSANKNLLTERERKRHFTEHKMEGLLRGDTKTRFEAHALAIQNMWMSPNEVRNLENMNPIPGGDEFKNPNISPGGGEPSTEPPPNDDPA
jgi:HK97 family phage portal protein